MARSGKLIFTGPLPKTAEEKTAAGGKIVFSPDSVHPYPETGHELYLQAIVRSLPAIQAESKKPGPHLLGTPFTPDHYQQAQIVPINKAIMSAGFQRIDPQSEKMRWFGKRLPALQRADKPGETIHFKFKGTRAAIYDVIGPDCGQVIVTLDDQPPVVQSRFDSYCTYHRLATLLIGTELPDTVHTVKIEIHPEQPDKAKILSQRGEKINDPKRFDDRAFYPGALLLVGELAD